MFLRIKVWMNRFYEKKCVGMRKVLLKDGYCVFPSDWIVLDNIFGAPEDCMYAGYVVNSNKSYGTPHFVFFSNKYHSSEYDSEFRSRVLEECEMVYPDIRKLLEMHVPDTGKREDDEAWEKAPDIHLVYIREKGDPAYWGPKNRNTLPSNGEMIVRSFWYRVKQKLAQ